MTAEAARQPCRACGALVRAAFCARCWRVAPLIGRYELAWWHGEFRAALTDEEAGFAHAAWNVVASWLADLIRGELQKRQASKLMRKLGARKRPKTLADLALEAEDEARA